jgi:hypothetical protein
VIRMEVKIIRLVPGSRWRLSTTHSSRCRDRRARRGQLDAARRSGPNPLMIEPCSLQIAASSARSSRKGRPRLHRRAADPNQCHPRCARMRASARTIKSARAGRRRGG